MVDYKKEMIDNFFSTIILFFILVTGSLLLFRSLVNTINTELYFYVYKDFEAVLFTFSALFFQDQESYLKKEVIEKVAYFKIFQKLLGILILSIFLAVPLAQIWCMRKLNSKVQGLDFGILTRPIEFLVSEFGSMTAVFISGTTFIHIAVLNLTGYRPGTLTDSFFYYLSHALYGFVYYIALPLFLAVGIIYVAMHAYLCIRYNLSIHPLEKYVTDDRLPTNAEMAEIMTAIQQPRGKFERFIFERKGEDILAILRKEDLGVAPSPDPEEMKSQQRCVQTSTEILELMLKRKKEVDTSDPDNP